MRFKPSLWDDSEPEYAPGMSRARDTFYWKATQKYVDMGLPEAMRRHKLTGIAGDGRDLDRAAEARAHTRAMLAHFKAEEVEAGTWAWIIQRYRLDKESPFQDVKGNTRQNYDMLLDHWRTAIGGTLIAHADFQAARRWQGAMKDKGRSTDWIHRMFRMIRTVTRYGALLGDKDCIRFKAILSDMRIKAPKPKQTEGTPEQIAAVVAAAEAAGMDALVLGWAMQWWFGLRAVDVRGQWLPLMPNEDAAIVRNGQRWADGLTWDMIDRDLTRMTKTLSKTEGSTGITKTFDLMLVPEIRERLAAIPIEKRVGPVILNPKTDLPYSIYGWSQAWRRYRKVAGVPSHVWNMGTRAAAITHGERAGASPFQLRDAAGHSNVTTTNRYVRGADEATANVINLRRSGRKK